MTGTLYLVATPIGNLEDVTLRALRVLAEADLIAAEDTRVSRKLLNHFEIKKPLISYYEQNKRLREGPLLAALADGKTVALISDAGTPCLSDPGSDLVRAAQAIGAEVIALPGASALLTALTSCGLDRGPFVFLGFPGRQRSERRKLLSSLARESRVMVFYEAPHRLLATLDDMAAAFGPERQLAACRELTKKFEEKRLATIEQHLNYFREHQPRGEFTLVVAGAEVVDAVPDRQQAAAAMRELVAQGVPRRQAARQVAAEFGLQSREIYEFGLHEGHKD